MNDSHGWRFESDVPSWMQATTVTAPDGAAIAGTFQGIGVRQAVLSVTLRDVAADDGGKGRDGWLVIPLADFHASDQRVLRDRLIAAAEAFGA